jgi:3D-(3,5/4)-trihydroxycyclohexane-1,2-dione acylhydrolase (decyclizing)
VLLFDNSGFGCIQNLQMSQGIPSFNTEFRYRNEASGRLDGGYIPIDYAKCAEGYGAKTYTATNIQELRAALEDAKNSSVSTLIDIKVLPGSMTGGYENWWRVGVPEVSEKRAVLEAHEKMAVEIAKTKKF